MGVVALPDPGNLAACVRQAGRVRLSGTDRLAGLLSRAEGTHLHCRSARAGASAAASRTWAGSGSGSALAGTDAGIAAGGTAAATCVSVGASVQFRTGAVVAGAVAAGPTPAGSAAPARVAQARRTLSASSDAALATAVFAATTPRLAGRLFQALV